MRFYFFFVLFFVIGFQNANSQVFINIYKNDGTVIQIPLNDIDSVTFTGTANPNNPTIATLTTDIVTNIMDISAISGGNISSDGGSSVVQRGVCYSTTPTPTVYDFITQDGTGIGNFTSQLQGLSPNTTYYVRAYAINNVGVAYGNEISFTTLPPLLYTQGPGVTFHGEFYPSIIINNGQEWMARNLTTTLYANGDTIPEIQGDTAWASATAGGWSHYYNMPPSTGLDSGKFYNWFAVNDQRNICPTGWHVPTASEWTSLYNFLGGPPNAGNKLKLNNPNIWADPIHVPTNESGFSGLPGGMRNEAGFFQDQGSSGYWWTSTEFQPPSIYANMRYIRDNDSYGLDMDLSKNTGLNVRCLKN